MCVWENSKRAARASPMTQAKAMTSAEARMHLSVRLMGSRLVGLRIVSSKAEPIVGSASQRLCGSFFAGPSSAGCFRFSALSVVLSGYFLISHRPAPRAAAVRNPVPEELKPYTETIPGTQVKFEMIPIPGGTFTMGTPPGELKRSDDEGPQHL